MDRMKLDVMVAFFAYGGNGGIAMQLPEITSWFAKLTLEQSKDERIGRFGHKRYGDVPLTMERNRAVVEARDNGFDVLVMIDSDNVPDLYLDRDPTAKNFFWTSFDFLYDRKVQGLPTVVAAPYCGPPPHPVQGGMENVYAFFVEDYETDRMESGYAFQPYSRNHAASMRGIHPIAAGPTGCIIYSLDAFDLMPVGKMSQSQILDSWKDGAISKDRAIQLLNMQSYFFYEYTDAFQTKKASTEDVTNLREIQFSGCAKYNQPVVFCNWDAWAGHYKPKCVGKPNPVSVNEINPLYREAVAEHMAAENNGPAELMTFDFDFISDEDSEPDTSVDVEEDASTGDAVVRGAILPAIAAEMNEDGTVKLGEGTLQSPFFDIDVRQRMIGNHKVLSVGHNTDDPSLDAIRTLVRSLAYRKPEAHLRVIEVGSWVGESAISMMQGFGAGGGTVYCVDTWEGSPTDRSSMVVKQLGSDVLFKYFKQNVGDLLGDKIRPIKGDSVVVADSFVDSQEADLIFLDAGHDYDDCMADIKAWMRHLADDGIMCGHDFTGLFPGVLKAVKEFCDEAGICAQVIEHSTVWFFTKRDYLKGMEAKKQKAEKRERSRKARSSRETADAVS